MTKKRPAVFYFRLAMAAFAILLPLLSLLILGSLWLWQNGFVLYWAMGACAIAISVYALERWLFRVDLPDTAETVTASLSEAADPAWSVREQSAWSAVVELSKHVRPLEIKSRDEIFDLGVRTIETVALTMHPGETHALWKFTIPEALALIEQVSSQLSRFVSENIPLGDRMTVGQFLRLYRWRAVVNVAEHAYDLWRIIRLVNPAAAVTQEIREQLTRRTYEWGREELAKRLAQAYVREIGRAAIDLYSGRMRLAQIDSPNLTSSRTAAGSPIKDKAGKDFDDNPIRILIAGPAAHQKQLLINGLMYRSIELGTDDIAKPDYIATELEFGDGHQTVLIASPEMLPAGKRSTDLLEAADQSDIIVWVTLDSSEHRTTERANLDAVRKQSATRLKRKPQPVIGVVMLSDPINGVPLTDQDTTADRMTELREDLGFEPNYFLAASMTAGNAAIIEMLRQKLVNLMPEAERIRRLRQLDSSDTSMKWGRLLSQVVNAGKSWRVRPEKYK